MELNQPLERSSITLDGKTQFCEEGNRLAWEYLTTARDALRKPTTYPNNSGPPSRVVESLESFLRHTRQCSICDGK